MTKEKKTGGKVVSLLRVVVLVVRGGGNKIRKSPQVISWMECSKCCRKKGNENQEIQNALYAKKDARKLNKSGY